MLAIARERGVLTDFMGCEIKDLTNGVTKVIDADYYSLKEIKKFIIKKNVGIVMYALCKSDTELKPLYLVDGFSMDKHPAMGILKEALKNDNISENNGLHVISFLSLQD